MRVAARRPRLSSPHARRGAIVATYAAIAVTSTLFLQADAELRVYLGIALLLWTFRDVTRRHEAEAALVRATEAAGSASRAKGDFLARMSHELRTPLTSIIAYAQLLRGRATIPAEELDMVERVLANGQRLSRIVTAILEFTELQGDGLAVRTRETDVGDLVIHVAVALGAEAPATVRVRAEVPEGSATTATDPTLLRRVLELLGDNALKFTERGEVAIVVVTDGERNTAAVEVRDTGIGVPADRREAIFEPFEQGDGSSGRRFGGVGMGLSLARTLARAFGADVSVHDRPGGGTTFRVDLQAARARQPVVGGDS
jgi:signal transduction histidine kinase